MRSLVSEPLSIKTRLITLYVARNHFWMRYLLKMGSFGNLESNQAIWKSTRRNGEEITEGANRIGDRQVSLIFPTPSLARCTDE